MSVHSCVSDKLEKNEGTTVFEGSLSEDIAPEICRPRIISSELLSQIYNGIGNHEQS